jgi:hypothetical protein
MRAGLCAEERSAEIETFASAISKELMAEKEKELLASAPSSPDTKSNS